jgi:hypothetical protein
MDLVVGTISRTARVSLVTRNLKEAEGKVPHRRTETVYRHMWNGRVYNTEPSPTLHGFHGVNAAVTWDESYCS